MSTEVKYEKCKSVKIDERAMELPTNIVVID